MNNATFGTFFFQAGNNTHDNNPALPNARFVATELFHQGQEDIPNEHGLSNLFWLYGQGAVDHDMTLTAGNGMPHVIPVPQGDKWFDPFNTGKMVIPMTESATLEGTGGETGNPPVFLNTVTPLLDGSFIYGSDAHTQAALRGENGKMKVSEGNMLPYNTLGVHMDTSNPNQPQEELFAAGDVRANENLGLLGIHTLFVREHNRLVDVFAAENPALTDEELFHKAKTLVTAMVQHITVNEFLKPLGVDLGAYGGYDSTVNPNISMEFATAAFRFGHTMAADLVFLGSGGTINLRDNFFAPQMLTPELMEDIVQGMSGTHAQQIDTKVVDGLNHFLFGPPGAGGVSLPAINIERGRINQLSGYNDVREAFGLERVASFHEVTSNSAVAEKLTELYGSPDNADIWVAGLAEDHIPGAAMGETFAAIIKEQFLRTRAADPNWYENILDADDLELVRRTSMSDIILRNTEIDYLQQEAFFASKRQDGTNGRDVLTGTEERDLLVGFAGNDVLIGNANVDDLYGGYGKDILIGSSGNDYLNGEQGRDTLIGGSGDDQLVYDKHDMIIGGSGKDILIVEGGGHVSLNKVQGIEVIDLFNDSHNVLNLRNGGFHDDLMVLGSTQDHVDLHRSATFDGSVTQDGRLFDQYTQFGSTMLIQQGIQVI